MARMDRLDSEKAEARRWRRRTGAAAAIAAAALYAVFLWPVARHAATDIPRSSRISAADPARRVTLAPGDHLQLLYHFQLVGQMTRGEIPPFANPWEFNLGEDPSTPDPYYAPFSLLYAALERPFGPAGAWNATQLASVLVGALLLLALARRYAFVGEDGIGPAPEGAVSLVAFAATLAALSVPYRWETLAGGSPTGFGMAWVPGVALGLDIAVRDRRISGGLLAGVMLLLCYTTDLHCFLFAGLAAPLWCVVAALHAKSAEDITHAEFAESAESGGVSRVEPSFRGFVSLCPCVSVLKALVPFAACGAIAVAIAHHLRRAYAATDAAGGRTIADLRGPLWEALLDPTSGSLMAPQFFLGWGLVLAIVVAGALAIATLVRRRAAAAALLLALAIFGAILLAMSQRGPMQGIVLRAVRKLVPPFRMVRQPIKVFCLLPTLLAPLFAWGVSSGTRGRYRDLRGIFLLALPVLCLVPVARSMRTATCVLPRDPSAAYAAAVADAQSRGETARALVLPIWPGDSSWSSVYQYHAAATGLRMVNGYAAVKTPGYVEDVFGRFQTVTQGELTDDDLAALARYKVNTILLHEDAFPEKVSPAPVGATLRRLLAHPALEPIAQDGPVWAWRIKKAPYPLQVQSSEVQAQSSDLKVSAPAPPLTSHLSSSTSHLPPLTSSCGCVASARAWHFDPPFQPTPERPLKAPLHKTAGWMREAFRWHIVREDGSVETLPPGEEDARGTSWLRVDSGTPVRDVLFAPTPFVEPGFLPAADLFHAGFTVLGDGGEPCGVDISGVPAGSVAIYGPRLLLREPGAYGVRVRSVFREGDRLVHGALRTGDRLEVLLGGKPVADLERWFASRPCDGPLEIRLIAGGEGPCLVEGFELVQLERTP